MSPKVRNLHPAFWLVLGLLAGITVQKYYPIGHLLRIIGLFDSNTARQAPPRLAQERIEIALNTLPQERVMVALILGQSNSANFGQTRNSGGQSVYNFHRGKLYRAQDPLLGADGDGGSVWTRLGDKIIQEQLYRAVIFVPLGVGGSSLSRWTPAGDLHQKIIDAVAELKAQRLSITHLFWHQGEQDAVLKTTGSEYNRMFLDMLSSVRSRGVDAPIYVSIASRCETEPENREIQEAQRALVERAKGIFPGPHTDLLGLTYRYDGCHFSDQGLDYAALLWLHALKLSPAPEPSTVTE